MPKLCASYTGSLTSPAPTASSAPTRQPAAEAAEGLAFPGICADADITSATLHPWVPTGPYQDADAWDLGARPSIDTFVELPGALARVSFGNEVELLIEKPNAGALGVFFHGASKLVFSVDAGIYLGKTTDTPPLCSRMAPTAMPTTAAPMPKPTQPPSPMPTSAPTKRPVPAHPRQRRAFRLRRLAYRPRRRTVSRRRPPTADTVPATAQPTRRRGRRRRRRRCHYRYRHRYRRRRRAPPTTALRPRPTLSATDAAADSVSDGEAFFDADDGANDTAVAPADYFAPNHITRTDHDSDHVYAYDCASLQRADDRSAVAIAVAEPRPHHRHHAVAAAEHHSIGKPDGEPDVRSVSARTDDLAGRQSPTIAPTLLEPPDPPVNITLDPDTSGATWIDEGYGGEASTYLLYDGGTLAVAVDSIDPLLRRRLLFTDDYDRRELKGGKDKNRTRGGGGGWWRQK